MSSEEASHDSERLRRELFAMVSHELRGPLGSIIGYLELARESAVGPQRGYLDVVDRNARRLLRLVDDLLFSAQVEAGQMPLTRTDFDLVKCLEETVEDAAPRARAGGTNLELVIERSAVCQGDRDRVRQVVDNLVANALKFTPPGGRVTVRLARAEREAVVQISDSGMGIPLEEQSQLFERFYRSADAVQKSIPGIGLGLSIVKAIVEAHGGRIGVRGNEAGGATFELALPLRAGVCEGVHEASGRSSRSEPDPRPAERGR